VEGARLLYFSRIRAAEAQIEPAGAYRSPRLQPTRLAGDVLIKALYS
jgi:hypothetical protein